jgi:two-component system, cell cycle response regulator
MRMNRQTILVIDDSPDTHTLLGLRLSSEAADLHAAHDGKSGLLMAGALKPDLILLDVNMPDLSGFDVCRALKSDPATSSIPVIFLTGTSDTLAKVEGFDLGAVDYVTKPFEPAELRARVRAALRTKRYVDLLASRAEIDALTGLYNRAHMDRRLAESVAGAATGGHHASIILIDVDHFKSVNDTYGHPFGDTVLQRVADAIASGIKGEDVACRYGGEEFAVVLSATPGEPGREVAERLLGSIRAISLKHKNKAVRVSASAGVGSTELFGLEAIDPSSLLLAADTALYEAKRSGRDRVCLARSRPGPEGRSARPAEGVVRATSW